MFLISKIKNLFFPFYRIDETKKIFSILNSKNKKEAMFVGGCVRKYLLKEDVDDIDIATTLTPDEIIKKFENTEIKVKKTGIEHGTLTLVLGKKKFEVTTLRKDLSTDGRHADIEFTENWKKDSERRDFTINSIYLDEKGKIYDPQEGFRDLKNNKVKFIGNADARIKEDYLRILRFLRFSIQYRSFEIDKQTQKAIKINLNGITKLSKERVYSELEKTIILNNFYDLLQNEFLTKIFKLIFPEFTYLDRIKKLKKLKNVKIDKDLIFAIMLIDSSNNHKYFFHKYNLPKDLIKNLDLFSDILKEIKLKKDFFSEDLKKNIFLYGRINMRNLFLIHSIINKKTLTSQIKEILEKINRISIPKFPVTGNDLIKLGLSRGIKVGEVLKKIEHKWIDNNFKIKQEEIKILVENYVD
ncbi:MAG: hypothetical protein CMG67_01680 [Candidatus Marinimicrobia bacterium]|nr:hypothetical protein [Candidatus Neomarinimicrobiota bacterium]|tara:strand:+ start:4130 stop:5368 length:1239 start_codon:yes stop_codon:yes gene_type:complete